VVFNEIWNHLKTRATRCINKLVSEIDRYPTITTPIHDPRPFNHQSHHPACTLEPSTFPSRRSRRRLFGWRLLFSPAFSMFHSSSPVVVVIVSFAPLSLSVSIFACVLGLSAHHRRDHIPFHRFFSDLSKLALVPHHPDRLVPW
jgi:hypothetical protein